MSLPHNTIAGSGPAGEKPPGDAEAGRMVILFDGVCDVCNSGVAWVRARDTAGAFAFVPFQSPEVARRWPGLDPRALERALHVVAPDGSIRAGADALPLILSRLPGAGARWAARILGWPGVLAVARPVYAMVARLRPRRSISCLTNHGHED